MSYAHALHRMNEIQERYGLGGGGVRTVGPRGFDTVLANAKNRFETGPQLLNVPNSTGAGQGYNAGGATAVAGARRGPSTKALTPELNRMITTAAARHKVPVGLVKAVVRAESGFKSDATSPAGAQGLMQLMPATAKGLGVTDSFDPQQNLDGGAKYLKQLMNRFHGDVKKVLAGYNAGPGAVERYGGIPPYKETQHYVAKVLEYAAQFGYRP